MANTKRYKSEEGTLKNASFNMSSGAKGGGSEKDKASLAMEFFMCFLNVVPYKEVFFCFCLSSAFKIKEILCHVEDRCIVLIVLQCSIYRGRESEKVFLLAAMEFSTCLQ